MGRTMDCNTVNGSYVRYGSVQILFPMIPEKISFKISVHALAVLSDALDGMIIYFRPVTYEQKLYYSVITQVRKRIALKISAASFKPVINASTINLQLPGFEALALHQVFITIPSQHITAVNDNEVAQLIGYINQKFA